MVCTEMCRLRSDGTRLVPYDESNVRRLLPAEYKMTSEARAQKSALLVSRIPNKADTGEVRTALDEIGQNASLGLPESKFGVAAQWRELCREAELKVWFAVAATNG